MTLDEVYIQISACGVQSKSASDDSQARDSSNICEEAREAQLSTLYERECERRDFGVV